LVTTFHPCRREVLEDVEKSGRWSVGRLEKAVLRIYERVRG
jgi:hypothetical protein